MKTYRKAQEIFSKKLDQSIHRKNQKNSINILKYTSNSRKNLYNLYLYRRFFKKNFKKLYKAIIFKQREEYIFLSTLKKITFFIRRLIEITKLKKLTSYIKINLKKEYIKAIFNSLYILKNFVVPESGKKLKAFYLNLKLIIFLNLFEKKISFRLKFTEFIKLFKNKVRSFRNLKIFLRIKSKIKNFSLSYSNYLRSFIINYRLSNQKTKSYLKRFAKVCAIYSIPAIVLINSFLSLLLLSRFVDYIFPLYKYFNGNYIRPLYYRLTTIIPYLGTLTSEQIRLLINNIQTFINYGSIIYIAATLSAKNRSLLPPKIVSHMMIGTSFILLNFGLDLSQQIFFLIKDYFVSLIDISFYKIFLKQEQKVHFLRYLTNILTNERDLIGYYASKIFTRPTIQYDLSNNRYLMPLEPSWQLGRYEESIIKLIGNYWMFIVSSFYVPVYLMLGIILLYNSCYYVMYNKKPYLPVITDLANKLTPNNFRD